LKFYLYLILWISILFSFEYDTILAVEEGINTIDMIVLCDSVEMEGKFDIEFNYDRHINLLSSKKPKPIIFESLNIVSSNVSIKGYELKAKNNIRVEAIDPNTQLFIYKDNNKLASEIYVSRISAIHEYANVIFSNYLGTSNIIFGKKSKIFLEETYPDIEGWVLKIDGKFQVLGDGINLEVMENEKIKFIGDLEILSPEFPNNTNFNINFSYYPHIKHIKLIEGQMRYISKNDYAPNEFSVVQNGKINKNEIIENDFKINMNDKYYQIDHKDEYLHDFRIYNVKKGKILNIDIKKERLSINSYIEYAGESLFPKININVKYYLINRDGTIGDPLIEISNFENEKNLKDFKFFDGRRYLIEITIEKLLNDNLLFNYTIIGPHEDIIRNQVQSGIKYSHEFRCPKPSFDQQIIECYVRLDYQKTDSKDLKQYKEKTISFFTEIQSDIKFEIEDNIETKQEVEEDEKFQISKKLTLASETSDPIDICIFYVPNDGIELEYGDYLINESLRKGDSIEISTLFRSPFIEGNKQYSEIYIFIFYKIQGSDSYTIYLPEPTMRASIVENIIINKTFLQRFKEFLPIALTALISVPFTLLFQNKVLTEKDIVAKLEEKIKNKCSDSTVLKNYSHYIAWFIILFALLIITIIILGLLTILS